MGKNTNQTRYIGVIDVMGKRVAIELPFNYDFSGKGVMLPPLIVVNVSREYLGLPLLDELYVEAEFVLTDNQRSAAHAFNTTQQSLSLWLKNGRLLNQGEK